MPGSTQFEPRDRALLGAVCLAGLAFWIWFRLHTGIVLEDALITYRYAENLATGAGFVFNEGERVLGTTTPLLTVLLGAAGWLLGPQRIPAASNVFGFAAGLAAAVLLFDTLRRQRVARPFAYLALVGFFLHPTVLWTVTGGLETPLVYLFMTLSLWALARRRPTVALAACSLMVLTRVDGLVWSAVVLGYLAWSDRRALGRAVAVALALQIPWLVFSVAYFGNPLPHSVIAKRVIATPLVDADGLARIWSSVRVYLSALCESSFANGDWLAWAALVVLGVWGGGRPARLWRLLAVFAGCFTVAFVAGRAPTYFPWYMAPLAWIGLVLGVVGLGVLFTTLRGAAERRGLHRRLPAAVLTVIVALLLLKVVDKDRDTVRTWHLETDNELGLRVAVGEWLRENTPPGASVAMEAIGFQGYHCRRRVVDLAGLVTPEVVTIHAGASSPAAAFTRILERMRPDFLVLRSALADREPGEGDRPLFDTASQREGFARCYRELARFSAPHPDWWADAAHLTIYGRTPAGVSGPVRRAPAAKEGP